MEMIKCKIDNKDVIMNRSELSKWFVKNSASDGTVKKTIILYDTINNIKNGEFTMSDFNLNRLGMKVDPDGWALENYKANPLDFMKICFSIFVCDLIDIIYISSIFFINFIQFLQN